MNSFRNLIYLNILDKINLFSVAINDFRSIMQVIIKAAAVGTPTLTIYGPSDWRDWAPPGKKNQVVVPDMDCSPCHKKGCNGSGRSDCLDKLAVAKVQDAVETMLDNNLTISTKPAEVIE